MLDMGCTNSSTLISSSTYKLSTKHPNYQQQSNQRDTSRAVKHLYPPTHPPTHQPTKPKYIKMVHPFLIDQKAYLDRVSSASTSSQTTQTTYEQFRQSTSLTTHLFGSVSPRSSRLSVTSQTSKQDDQELVSERQKKQNRRRGVIGRLF